MPNKDWLHFKLYTTLVLSICYVFGQLVFSHFTHALTLQFSAYHMLCNIVALTGRMLTIKKNDDPIIRQIDDNIITGHITGAQQSKENTNKILSKKNEENCNFMKFTRTIAVPLKQRNDIEQKLRNTFGWVRIDCLFMSVCFIFLASFSSVHITEVLKTFLHMDHKHTAHYPEVILIYAIIGIFQNIFTFLLIGGYTIHQSNILKMNSNGNVIINQYDYNSCNNDITTKNMQLSKINIENNNNDNAKSTVQSYKNILNNDETNYKIQLNFSNLLRDISSLIFVIISSSIIYIMDSNTEIRKYVDPVTSLFSCLLLITLNFPYMHQSCLILLQTIPGSIDIENFQNKLLSKFHEIVKLHDFHIWSLTANKYVSTVHIIFKNQESYLKIMSDVKQFFHDQGIQLVTIQPEFLKQSLITNNMPEECLISCNSLQCLEKQCCQSQTDLKKLPSFINDLNCKSINLNEESKIKKHFRIINVNSLNEINTNSSKSISYLTNGNINNNSNDRINDENNIKKFYSDSQISSIGSTTSTNISITFDPDSSRNSCETNTAAITINNTNNSSLTSSNENCINERL